MQTQEPRISLEKLVFGSPVFARSEEHGDTNVEQLDTCLRSILEILKREIGDTTPCQQAVMEWERVLRNADARTFDGACVKRAAVLFALWKEPTVETLFQETPTVRDLKLRVLPIVMPRWVANMAQAPDALVTAVALMSTLWDGVEFGTHV